ncbi:hypothetical protein HN682_09850 [Candidatus Peregrinibacteria bacterium]|nr:hypothetical protein [Candidatus Peregrinibacteria bacterium]
MKFSDCRGEVGQVITQDFLTPMMFPRWLAKSKHLSPRDKMVFIALAQDWGYKEMDKSLELEYIPSSQGEMCSWVGLSLEAFKKSLNKLKSLGVIETEKIEGKIFYHMLDFEVENVL